MPISVKATAFYQTSGALRLETPSYVKRSADSQILQALSAGELCYVLNTRQMGKSSLMTRAARGLREAGHTVAVIDLSSQETDNSSPDAWYGSLLLLIAEQIGLLAEAQQYLNGDSVPHGAMRFFSPLRRVLLPKIASAPPDFGANSFLNDSAWDFPKIPIGRLTIFVDEIDAILSLPFSVDPFFAGIRACFNQRPQEPLLDRLTFCLLGVATPNGLIQDVRTTPFNIGTPIELNDFTPEEAAPLAVGLNGAVLDKGDNNYVPQIGDSEAARSVLNRVLYWTGGHPAMTQKLCENLATRPANGKTTRLTAVDVDRVCEDLFLSRKSREIEPNLAFAHDRLLYTAEAIGAKENTAGRSLRPEAEIAGLLDLYGRILRSRDGLPYTGETPLADVLRLAGVIRVSNDRVSIRNRIYAHIFNQQWITQNMPGAEQRRQREAKRKGRIQVTLILTPVFLLLMFFVLMSQSGTETHRNDLMLMLAVLSFIAAPVALIVSAIYLLTNMRRNQ